MDCVLKIFLVVSCLAAVQSAPRQKRLTVAENEPNHYYNNNDGHGIYSFGYDVSDVATGNTQYRSEQRYSNGTVTGGYGYVDPNGVPRRFRYIADKLGYRVFPDLQRNQPYVLPHSGTEATESSITWTRPPKPYKNKVINNFVAQLGTIFAKNNLI
ncbi:uncharacterized protein LOC113502586 [Trichoplusia ni]|uniref:Uncharacterized protein LOC113502586 n=1 Tax=Trichoplusia ni TaxID=7111 RepID=A0A7E5WH04_TRINI|nr:uncharacterized protein LOC113502586 [Trichoplusia ni]